MEVHTRVGIAAGVFGFALLYLAQLLAGAAAVLLAPVVGLLAGLGIAKWLPRAWYGRQLEAGARAGVLACGGALAGFLLSLIVAGAHSTQTLAARSHLMGIDLGSVVRALDLVGWLGAALVLALLGLGTGTGLAALASQVGAWDKNRHAIEVVKRARVAAQNSHRLAAAVSRTAPNLPNLPGAAPTHVDVSRPASDLEGLNESWHTLRSPLNVFPAPEKPDQPWSRYDERLPPGALLPDELALEGIDSGADADASEQPADWDDAAWRSDPGWMDYEDDPRADAEPDEPEVTPPPTEEHASAEADEPDDAEEDGAESDSWLN